MPDFLRKATRQTRKVCEPDETPVAALFTRPRKGDEVKRLGTPGGAISKVGKFADEADSAEGDRIEAMFGQNAVLVLTPDRLLAFAHGTYSGRVKELIGALALSSITAMDLDAPPIGESGPSTLEITFRDGSAVSLTPGSRRRRFVEAFQEMAQPA